MSGDLKYFFIGSLQPIDAQDDSNMEALSYSTKSCAVCRFTSVFAGNNLQTKAFALQHVHMLNFFLK